MGVKRHARACISSTVGQDGKGEFQDTTDYLKLYASNKHTSDIEMLRCMFTYLTQPKLDILIPPPVKTVTIKSGGSIETTDKLLEAFYNE